MDGCPGFPARPSEGIGREMQPTRGPNVRQRHLWTLAAQTVQECQTSLFENQSKRCLQQRRIVAAEEKRAIERSEEFNICSGAVR